MRKIQDSYARIYRFLALARASRIRHSWIIISSSSSSTPLLAFLVFTSRIRNTTFLIYIYSPPGSNPITADELAATAYISYSPASGAAVGSISSDSAQPVMSTTVPPHMAVTPEATTNHAVDAPPRPSSPMYSQTNPALALVQLSEAADALAHMEATTSMYENSPHGAYLAPALEPLATSDVTYLQCSRYCTRYEVGAAWQLRWHSFVALLLSISPSLITQHSTLFECEIEWKNKCQQRNTQV